MANSSITNPETALCYESSRVVLQKQPGRMVSRVWRLYYYDAASTHRSLKASFRHHWTCFNTILTISAIASFVLVRPHISLKARQSGPEELRLTDQLLAEAAQLSLLLLVLSTMLHLIRQIPLKASNDKTDVQLTF